MDWSYKGKKITRLPPEVVGFVYMIYYTNGQKYIGKKLAKDKYKDDTSYGKW